MTNQLSTGNTFDEQEFKVGHAKKVWRRTQEQLPGGFLIKNVADFVADKGIRSGMAVVKDTSEGADDSDVKVLKWSDITDAVADGGAGIDSLGIIGFTLEDVPVKSANT